MVAAAFELSEKYEIPRDAPPHYPHLPRPAERGGRATATDPGRRAAFVRNPARWAATPAFLPGLHRELNAKLAAIAAEADLQPRLTPGDGSLSAARGGRLRYRLRQPRRSGRGAGAGGKTRHLPGPDALSTPSGFCGEAAKRLRPGPGAGGNLPASSSFSSPIPGPAVEDSGAIRREGELTPDRIHRALAAFLGLPAPAEAGARRTGPAPLPLPRLPPPQRLLQHQEVLPERDLPLRHRLLYPGDQPRRRRHRPLHGGLHQPGSGLLPGLRPGRRLPDGGRHHRRLDLLPRRPPGAGQRRHPAGAHHRRHPRQRHHRHDRPSAGAAPGPSRRRQRRPSGGHRTVGAGRRRPFPRGLRPLRQRCASRPCCGRPTPTSAAPKGAWRCLFRAIPA